MQSPVYPRVFTLRCLGPADLKLDPSTQIFVYKVLGRLKSQLSSPFQVLFFLRSISLIGFFFFFLFNFHWEYSFAFQCVLLSVL